MNVINAKSSDPGSSNKPRSQIHTVEDLHLLETASESIEFQID